MERDLKRLVLKNVDVQEFYNDQLEGYEEGQNACCPFHNDNEPSLSIRKEDGAFYCHSCRKKGTSVVGFYEALHKVPYKKALESIYHHYIQQIVPFGRIRKWSARLLKNTSALAYLEMRRGVASFTAKLLRLGWDGERFVIPIINEYGLCCNVRRYHPKLKPKILSYRKGFGQARLYPLNRFRERDSTVYLFEGELDTILAWQMGLNALTTTVGAGYWNPKFNRYLKQKDVVICYDCDDPGQEGAELVAKAIEKDAKSVKNVNLECVKGKDLTDYVIRDGKNRRDFLRLVTRSVFHSTPQRTGTKHQSVAEDDEITHLSLSEASRAAFYFRPLRTEGHVTGKRLTPFMVPWQYSVSCNMDRGKTCESCHMLPHEGRRKFKFRSTDKHILGLVDASDVAIRRVMREHARIPTVCSIRTDTISTANIEEITVIPPIDDLGASYTARRSYFVGHGLPSNRSYVFEGYTVPHPENQSATHVFTKAKPAQTQLESYVASADTLDRLESFRPNAGQSVNSKVQEIGTFLSERVTRILRRPEMHTAIDLVFHSPLSFHFNNERLKKGWLEAAIVGDTRCGKGFVATELCKFYGVGEIATAENCSFAGLIGGILKNGNNMSITWGVIPRNTGRMVIIDETSGLTVQDIARMTRVRSEGVAEIYKIQAEATQARTRILWLSNSRSGRPVNSYAYGVEAVAELFGKTEDISKLDYALVVQGGDVPPEVINEYRPLAKKGPRYERDDFRNLIMWIWTRAPSQVLFTEGATRIILQAALDLGHMYHPSIPLVQIEDIRIKIARISAAFAGRIFSTDATRQVLAITRPCAQAAVSFLRKLYDNPPTSYKFYSASQIEATTIQNEAEVYKLIKGTDKMLPHLVSGLLDTQQISITDVTDFMNCDKFTAKDMIGKLVRLKCLVKQYTYYVKRPAFIDLLRSLR